MRTLIMDARVKPAHDGGEVDATFNRPHGEERTKCASRTMGPPHPSRRALCALLRMRAD
jgi:hypothetical protein